MGDFMNKKREKKWFISCIVSVLATLFGFALLVYVFDPYFHFHKPYPFVRYRMYDERYTNDGISRNFDYNCIITGTSMAQNFKTSELDEIFEVQSVKETFSGAGFQELSDNLDRTLRRNPDCKTVIWSVDYSGLIRDKDWTQYEGYPTFLYDDNPFNDVSYIYNKSLFYHGVLSSLSMTLKQEESTTFDEYSSWDKPTGLKYILNSYHRNPNNKTVGNLSDEEIQANIKQNMIDLARKYPDVTFYMFYTPYSICYWDALHLQGELEKQLHAEQLATEMLLQEENIRLYNFFDQTDVICNLDNYRDKEHYSAEVNSQILKWLREGTGLITEDNYLLKLSEEREFFTTYDYELIYQ